MKYTVNIIARSNGVGLDSDVALLSKALKKHGVEVNFSHNRSRSYLASLLGRDKNKYDVNIFLERIFPRWLGTAKHNLLIPNQERFPHRHVSRLKNIDKVLCKSRHAEEIFLALGCDTHFTGFTSKDQNSNGYTPCYSSFFHLAGKSTLKGTESLLSLWKKHPEWPKLTIVQHQSNAPDQVPPNVNLIAEYVSDEDLNRLINKHGIHLCPSLSEGWGHYIVEAMSCKAVVVTTDGPPMNELVNIDRGILVTWDKSEARHLGTNFYVNIQDLESKIENLLQMDLEEKQAIGLNAQSWYHNNDDEFQTTLFSAIQSVLK